MDFQCLDSGVSKHVSSVTRLLASIVLLSPPRIPYDLSLPCLGKASGMRLQRFCAAQAGRRRRGLARCRRERNDGKRLDGTGARAQEM